METYCLNLFSYCCLSNKILTIWAKKGNIFFSSFRLRGTLPCFSFYKTLNNPFLIVMHFSNVLETTWCIIVLQTALTLFSLFPLSMYFLALALCIRRIVIALQTIHLQLLKRFSWCSDTCIFGEPFFQA